MADVIVRKDLENAKFDADSIAKFVNGLDTEVVVTRTGATYPTANNIVKNVATNVLGAISISTGIYATTAAGIAATVNGQFFSVISAETLEYVILYQNVAGVATEKKRYPSDQAIKQIIDAVSVFDSVNPANNTVFSGNRFVIFKLLANGALDMLTARLNNSDVDGLAISDQTGFSSIRLGTKSSNLHGLKISRGGDGRGIYFLDSNNFVLAKLTTAGAYWGGQLVSGAPVVNRVPQLEQQQNTDYKHLIVYGQSLSVGTNAMPAISLVQDYQNVMIKSGVRIHADQVGYDASALIPLVETELGNQGETPVSGWANGITRRAVAAGEPVNRWAFIGCAPGRSGNSVEQLSPRPLGSGTNYEPMIQQLTDVAALCKLNGRTHSVWGYQWVQGESNYLTEWEKSPVMYMQYQMKLFDTLSEDCMRITGQSFRPYLFSYQVAAHRRYSRDDMPIALTQWRISRQRPDVVLGTPCYIFKTGSDNLHLTNEASWLLGEYMSRATYQTMINRAGKWRPLEPIDVDWKDTTIDIKFHVPCGQLFLDDALATLTQNMGFDIRENEVLADIITGVSIVGKDTIHLTLSRAANSAAVLSYARGRSSNPNQSGPVTGARGNLRDSHGDFDQVTSPLGNTFNLHNACVMFQYSRKDGF